MTALPLGNVIEQAKLAEYFRNEKAIADRLPILGRSPISDGDRALLAPFINWCEGQKVRHCPASPAVVATFVRDFNWRGPKILVPMMRAIEALHDFFGIANPVATEIVRAAVAEMFGDELSDLLVIPKDAPHSWPKREKILFATLPKEIQAIIYRREKERDAEVYRALRAESVSKEKLQQFNSEKETQND